MNNFEKQIFLGYGLTLAEILYRMPDHPNIIQMYVWQDYDLSPKFPVLNKFLDFWQTNLDGPLYKVTVSHTTLIQPIDYKINKLLN